MRPFRFAAGLYAAVLIISALAAGLYAQARQPFSRVALVVTPDHQDWVYQPGEAVSFRIDVLRDGHQVVGTTVKYSVGPEMLPPLTQAAAVVSATPLTVPGGTMQGPGFLRLIATAEIDGRTYRGVGTAGFAPERIQPDPDQSTGLRRILAGRAGAAGGYAARREVDAAPGVWDR